MRKNVIILTHGWTGSSVFSGLLGTAGYWLGAETVKKVDYDTFENLGLVELNRRMMSELRFGQDHEHEFSADAVLELERRAATLDWTPYRAFLERCEARAPWAWKDPRLTWTIRQWHHLLPADRTAYIVLTRDDRQAWISSNLRRHVQSMAFTRSYNHGITASNIAFLEQHGLPYVRLSFEDLLLTPERTIEILNSFLGLDLTMDRLRSVFREPLYRKSRGVKDAVLAALIYLKNYGERDGRGRLRVQESQERGAASPSKAGQDADALPSSLTAGRRG